MNAFQQAKERASAKADHDVLRPHLSQEQNEELDTMRAEGDFKLKLGYVVFGGVLIAIGMFIML